MPEAPVRREEYPLPSAADEKLWLGDDLANLDFYRMSAGEIRNRQDEDCGNRQRDRNQNPLTPNSPATHPGSVRPETCRAKGSIQERGVLQNNLAGSCRRLFQTTAHPARRAQRNFAGAERGFARFSVGLGRTTSVEIAA